MTSKEYKAFLGLCALGVVCLLCMGFNVVSQNLNNTQFSISGTTVSLANPLPVNTLNVSVLTLTNASVTNLTATSQQTNYTVTLNAFPSTAIIYMANTNAFLTFLNTNKLGYECTVAFQAQTNSIVSKFTINLPGYMTNLNLVYFVTNNTTKFVNFYNLDTTGTNVVVSDAGTAPHS